VILLIHPTTGGVESITDKTTRAREKFDCLVLEGYEPVGPKAQALAAKVREAARAKAQLEANKVIERHSSQTGRVSFDEIFANPTGWLTAAARRAGRK